MNSKSLKGIERCLSLLSEAVLLMAGHLQYSDDPNSWWHHQMETFSTLLALCEGDSPVTGELPSQRPVIPSFDVQLNKRLSKQSWRQSLETPSHSLWRHCNVEMEQHLQVNATTTSSHRASTVPCCYNMVNLLTYPYKIHPIAHSLGWAMGCILCIQTVIYTLSQSMQWCMQYHVILDHVITAIDYSIAFHISFMSIST